MELPADPLSIGRGSVNLSVAPFLRCDPIGESEPDPGCSFNSFGRSKQEPGLLRLFSFILSKHFIYVISFFCFQLRGSISNSRPINIYFYTICLQNVVLFLYK